MKTYLHDGVALEHGQVALEHAGEDQAQVGLLQHREAQHGKVPLQPRVDRERARRGVHRGHELHVVDVLLQARVGQVVPRLVGLELAQQSDARLRAVLLLEGHVEVVHKVHEFFQRGRAVAACDTISGRTSSNATPSRTNTPCRR